jgi:hypothetical protein
MTIRHSARLSVESRPWVDQIVTRSVSDHSNYRCAGESSLMSGLVSLVHQARMFKHADLKTDYVKWCMNIQLPRHRGKTEH